MTNNKTQKTARERRYDVTIKISAITYPHSDLNIIIVTEKAASPRQAKEKALQWATDHIFSRMPGIKYAAQNVRLTKENNI